MPPTRTEIIDEIYILYLLNDRNATRTMKYSNISRPTLIKYIYLKEQLDFELFENLDKKGKEALTMDLAHFLCKNVLNPNYQKYIYSQLMLFPKKERKKQIVELSTCTICCDTSIHFEQSPCCKSFICESCLLTTVDNNLNDLAFTGIKCPFCNLHYSINYIKFLLVEKYKSNQLWRNTYTYQKNKLWQHMYPHNLYYKYRAIIKAIEHQRGFKIRSDYSDFKGLLGNDNYYGCCPSCTPDNQKHIDQQRQFRRLQIGFVEKQCVNAQNEIVVLEPSMFLCVPCKSRQENFDDGEFKKCPHCGIKTVKPDGCNYIYCGDHRWCFICNERVENNNFGHNHHYYTGPGTSAYSNQCRQSVDFDAPKFLIKNECDCDSCGENGGAPLCRTLECMNRTRNILEGDPGPLRPISSHFSDLCNECQ